MNNNKLKSSNSVVRVTGANQLVRGNAKRYSYVAAHLFEKELTKQGYYVWKSSTWGYPRRSLKVATKDAEEMAKNYNCEFDDSNRYSLHNQRTGEVEEPWITEILLKPNFIKVLKSDNDIPF